MNGSCPKCGAQLASPWRFCPGCGASIVSEIHEQASRAEAEKAPVKGAFGGLLIGMIAVPALIIFGTLLCLTGLGAILGVPLILGAVLAPLLGPLIGIGELRGKCPWCGAQVSIIFNSPGFACHACKQRIAIRNRRLIKAD
jgi:DNA-directed RNA polymerase subunit RPC12/RpoP